MSRNSHEPPDPTAFTTSLPSPPQTPGIRSSTRKGSFSFGSPFALLSGGKGKTDKDRQRKGVADGISEGLEDASGARRKRLPSGGIVLIKGPFPQTGYLPFSPPPDIPSLPPLPPNLAQLKAATMHKLSPRHRRSLSGFRGPATLGSGQGDGCGSMEPPLEALLSKSLPEEGLLAASPDFGPLTLELPRTIGRSRAGSLAPAPSQHVYAPPRASMGSRRPSIGASPPPRPPPPPPHLGLGALNRLKPRPRPVSKSNPNTPVSEIPDPFDALSFTQALSNAPKATAKGPAIRAVERADARMSLSGEARPDELMPQQTSENMLIRLPSAVFRDTQPLRVSPKNSPLAKVFDLPGRREGEKKDGPLQKSAIILPQGAALVPMAETKPKTTLPDRPSTSPSVSQSPPMSEKEKKIRSVLGLTFPHPPTPLLPYATAERPTHPENLHFDKSQKDMNADSPIIVPDMPKTPPMQQNGPGSPRNSPDRTVKAKRSMIIFRSDSWKQHKRKRSQSIAGSPTSSWTDSSGTPAMPPLPTSPQKELPDRPTEVPLSPSLSPREYALAHAQAHNEAQLHAIRKAGSPTVSPSGRLISSPSKRVGELEEENKLLREALKAHREKLHIAMRHSTDRGPRPITPPSATSATSLLQQPAHIVEGPPPVPLPPTPASPPKLLAVPVSPSRRKEPYSMLHAVDSTASITSLATGTSSTSSFGNSRSPTPQSPSRRETGTLFAEISSLQNQLAQAQGEIEVYKLLTTNTQMTKSPGESLKNAMKKCRSEPMLLAMVGLGIDGVADSNDEEEEDAE
ncbi:hypothetical protein CALCODRAFT_510387 [Calocera cornea HHB12733]|uniref:Uncharacterized protein n=1 Tax=Calocera cornea HHB12733 TaxID=1353952 RepID=A0A165EIW0_9BASI|nr:hypothetical protein CALCODRAFT_510387 [Calocera cornea HHB12733]